MPLHWLRPSRRPATPRPAKRPPLTPRWRPGVVELEDRLAPATRLFAGLAFDANSFVDVGTAVSATGPVLVGSDPGAGTFQPLLRLANGVSFTTGDAAGSFSTVGLVTAVAGGQSVPLLDAGESHTLTAPALLGGGLTVPAGEADSSGLTVAGMTFKLGSAKFAADAVTLQGSVSVPSLAGLTFAVAGADAVTIGTGGVSLTGLDVSTSAPMTFTRSGISFSAGPLAVHYAAAQNRFELTGTASLTAAGNTVGLSLGSSQTPGLVIAGGDLESLNATVTSPTFSVAGVTFGLTSATVEFDKPNSRFALSGTATAAVAGNTAAVTLGTGVGDGVVLKDGAVQSLNAAVTSDLTVGGLTLTTDGLRLVYNRTGGSLGVSGNAKFALGSNTVGLTLGTAAAPGLLLSNGALASLNATVTSNIAVGGLTFTSAGMGVEYRPSPNTDIRIKGTSTVTLPSGYAATVTFGGGGLVVKNGALDSLAASLSGKLTAGGLGVTFDALALTYDKATADFTLSGAAAFALGQNTVALQLGSPAFGDRPATKGVVLHDGSLVSLDAAVTGQVKAGVTLAADRLRVQYESPSTVRVTGKSTFTLGGNSVSVDLGGTGLVVQNGALVSLNATVDGSLKAGGLTFTPNGLNLNYLASGSAVTVTGGAKFALGSNTVGVTFTGDGLQMSGGSLVSLDASIDSNLAVGGLTFTSAGMSLAYRAAQSDIRIGGTSTVTLPGGSSASVTFAAANGLVIEGGVLTSLDATLSGTLTAGGLGVTLAGVNLVYSAADSSYSLKGNAQFTLPGQAAPVSISLGSATTNGIVLQSGVLTELNASVSTSLTFGGLTFAAAGMAVEYRALGDDIRIGGTTSVTLPGGTATASVAFGGQGVVIKSGVLDSLDATLNGTVKAGGLEVTLAGVALKYAANSLSLKGTATILAAGRTVSLALGSATAPGLVITNGTVTTLNAAVSADLTFGGLAIRADALGIQYAAADGTRVAITGSASLTLPGGTGAVGLQLGTPAHPGLVFVNGTLTDLNLGVTADFNLKGLRVGVRELTVGYTPAAGGMAERLTIDGALFLSTGGPAPVLDRLSAVLGSKAANGTYTHGLLVEGGVLKQFDISVSGGFNLYGVSVTATDLHVRYDSAKSQVSISGAVAAKLASIAGAVRIPAPDLLGNGGLTINTSTGAVEVSGLTLDLNAKVGSFGAGLHVAYSAPGGVVTVSGSGSVAIPGVGQIGASFAVVDGQLDEIGLFYNGNLQVGQTPFYVTHLDATLSGLSDASTVTFVGHIDVTLARSLTVAGTTVNLLTARGSLTVDANHLVIGGDIWLLAYSTSNDPRTGLPNYQSKLGHGSATIDLNWAAGVYSAHVNVDLLDSAFIFDGTITITKAGAITVLATADVRVPASLPVIGGKHLGNVGFYLQIRPDDPNQTYAAAWARVSLGLINTSVGFLAGPTRGVKLIGQDQITQLQNQNSQADYAQFYQPNTGQEAYVKFYETPWNGVDAQFLTLSTDALLSPVITQPDSYLAVSAVGRLPNGGSVSIQVARFSLQTVADASGPAQYDAYGNLKTVATNDPATRALPIYRSQIPANGYLGATWYLFNTSAADFVGVYEVRLVTSSRIPANQLPVIYFRPLPSLPRAVFQSAALATNGSLGFQVFARSYQPTGAATDDAGTKVSVYYSYDPPGSDTQSRLLMTEQYLGGPAFNRDSTFGVPYRSVRSTGGTWTGNWADYLSLVPGEAAGRPIYLSVTVNDGQREAVTAYFDANPATTAVDPLPTPTPLTVTVPAGVLLDPASGFLGLGSHRPDVTSVVDGQFTIEVRIDGQPLRLANAGGTDLGTSLTFPSRAAFDAQLGNHHAVMPADFAGAGTVTFRVTVTSGANTFVTEGSATVSSPTTLLLSTTASTTSPNVGQTVTVTHILQYFRDGALGSGGTVLPAVTTVAVGLPNTLTLTGATASRGIYSSATGVWSAGTLAEGDIVSLTMTFRVNADTPAGPAERLTGVPSGQTAAYKPVAVGSDVSFWPHRPITVDTLDDVSDPADGLTSFREAVTWATENNGADVIDLSRLSGVLKVGAALPAVPDSLTVTGPGAGTLTVRRTGADPYRLFDVAATGALTLSGVAVDGFGYTTSQGVGGAVRTTGRLTATGVDFTNNAAQSGGAVAVLDGGRADLIDVRFRGNAARDGGGVYVSSTDRTTVTRSLFDGNTVTGGGGGLFVNYGLVTVENSTFTDNSGTAAGSYGGGLASTYKGDLRLTASTVAYNRLPLSARGAGVFVSTGENARFVPHGALVAGNTAAGGAGSDVNGAVTDGRRSLFGVNTGTTGVTNGPNDMQVGTAAAPIDPKLSPSLEANGGRLPTLALRAGSPALNTGEGTGSNDQRGAGYVRTFNGRPDVGAFEAQNPALEVRLDCIPGQSYAGGRTTVQLVLTNATNSPITAQSVSGTFTLPPEFTGVGFDDARLTFTPATGTWALATPLAAGADIKANFTLAVAGDATHGLPERDLPLGVTVTSRDGALQSASAADTAGLRVFDPTPTVRTPADLTTLEDTRSASIRLTIPGETTYLRFTDVGGGRLTGGNRSLPIVPGAFYREVDIYGAGDPNAGLRFTPDPDVNSAAGGRFGFSVQAGITDTVDGLVGRATPVAVTVTPVNDAPTLSVPATLAALIGAGPQTVPGFARITAGPSNEAGQQFFALVFPVTNAALFAAGPTIYPDGTLAYTLAAGAVGTATFQVIAADTAGTANGGSNTSAARTVTVTAVRPVAVESTLSNGGDAQRSRVTSFTVTFNGEVTLDDGAFRAVRRGDGAAVGEVRVATTLVGGKTVAALTFFGANTEAGSLADGTWDVTVDRTKVRTAVGGFAPAADLRAGTTRRLFGDGNGDGVTDATDFAAFRTAYGKTRTQAGYLNAFDFNDDGAVNGTDLAQFRLRQT